MNLCRFIHFLLCRRNCCCRRPCDKCFCGCRVKFKHNFREGNQNYFLGGTEIIDNDDCTISVFGTAHTWFGGRQFIFPAGGFSTAAEVWLDENDIEEGEFFTWSSSLSSLALEINNGYLSETFTHVRKINGQIRLGAAANGSSPEINYFWTTSEDSIAIQKPGFYTIVTRYFENDTGNDVNRSVKGTVYWIDFLIAVPFLHK